MAIPVQTNRFGQFPVILAVPVALFLMLIVLSSSQSGGFVRAFGTALVVSAASGLVGAFFGFLFGMPRDLSGRTPPQKPSGEAAPAAANAGTTPANLTASACENGRSAWANNNLVEVSDWLTKIIVGIGLVEFKTLVPWIGGISLTAGEAAGFVDESAQTTFGASIILASFIYGFLLAYIYARTIIAVIFAKAQNEVDEELRIQLKQVVSEKAELATEKAKLEVREAVGQRRFEAVLNELPDEMKGPSTVLAALYAAPPGGFTEAVAKARALLADPLHATNPRLHAYLACGLGQSFRYRHERSALPDELAAIADEAYSALQKSLELDPALKPWLRSLWSRDDPDFRATEDDLTPFWDHLEQRERFVALLG